MQNLNIPGGIWPVMIAPFRGDGSLDDEAYGPLVQYYPVNAKYHMNAVEGLPVSLSSRRQDAFGFTTTMRSEVKQLAVLETQIRLRFGVSAE